MDRADPRYHKLHRLEENIGGDAVNLTQTDPQDLGNLLAETPVQGHRYSEQLKGLIKNSFLAVVEQARHYRHQTYYGAPMLTLHDVEAVSPALGKYTAQPLLGELWKRPDLIPRDRSIVTVAALIARNQVIEMPTHFELALENGVTPGEISEIITHLAFYAGWPNAMAALVVVKEIFTKRGVQPQDLPVASPTLLPIDQAGEATRAAFVDKEVGHVSPGLVLFTGKLVFQDLWLRPNLAPRDRSLITVSALIATGQVAQITFHLTKAMDNGLTKAQASEVLTHLAFYAGWPCAFSAVPIFRSVFATRGL